jgi:hypothetical protein
MARQSLLSALAGTKGVLFGIIISLQYDFIFKHILAHSCASLNETAACRAAFFLGEWLPRYR